MSFISMEFLLFVLAAAFVYYIIPARYQWMILLAFSYIFYAAAGIKLLFFLLFTTLTTYGTARWIDSVNISVTDKKEKKSSKRRILILGLLLNFGMLGLLKYSNFAISNFNSLFQKNFALLNFALPLGISFYTFQSMGYLIDVYWGRFRAERNPFRFALFVSFFPQLLQGPIGRFDRLAHQFFEEHSFDLTRVEHGLQRMMWGYFQKLVLADRAGVIVKEVFGNYSDYHGMTVAAAVLMYSIQLYGDFSGGMDVVLGVAEIFGITLDENFRQPYFSISITDFWHRWHITLGTWMKDYIFYPISLSHWMNRFGKYTKKIFGKQTGRVIPVALANIIVFLVVGIWHGAAWKYLMYGFYNGALIALANLLAPVNRRAFEVFHIDDKSRAWHLVRILRTFLLVNISWYFDIAVSLGASFAMMRATFQGFTFRTLTDGSLLNLGLAARDFVILAFGCAVLFAVSVIREKGVDIREALDRKPAAVRWCAYLALILSLPVFGYIMVGGGGFIYAQF